MKIQLSKYSILATLITIIFAGVILETKQQFSYIVFLIACVLILDFIVRMVSALEKNIYMVVFVGTFFTFLVGSELLQMLYYGSFTNKLSDETRLHMYVCLLLSVIFLRIGYAIRNSKKTREGIIVRNESRSLRIRDTSKALFFLTYFIYLTTILDTILFVRSYSYNEYYVNYTSHIPMILQKIGDFSPVCFFVFLATMPKKSEAKLPIVLMVFYNTLNLFSGKRYATIIFFAIMFAYLIKREKFYPKEETWFKKRQYLLLLILVPIIAAFSYWYGYKRVNLSISGNIFTYFLGFFDEIGKSTKTIAYGYDLSGNMPQKGGYLFGNLYDYFFCDNEILNIFYNSGIRKAQTASYALNGHSFSYSLSYLALGNRYLLGDGLGSCYIAEAYFDLGYFGVAIVNMFIGWAIRNLFIFDENKPWGTAISMYVLSGLFLMPRGSFDRPFCDILNIKFLIILLTVYALSFRGFRLSNKKSISGDI